MWRDVTQSACAITVASLRTVVRDSRIRYTRDTRDTRDTRGTRGTRDIRDTLHRQATFLFKKRYWETHEAEQLMSGGGAAQPAGLRLRPATLSNAHGSTVNYESDWRTGSHAEEATVGDLL